MLFPRKLQKHLVAIDSDCVPLRSNNLGNSRGDGAGSTANIQHGKTNPQQPGKMAVVSLKGSTVEDSGIGPV